MENIQDKQGNTIKIFSIIKKETYNRYYVFDGNKYRFIGYIKGNYTSHRIAL